MAGQGSPSKWSKRICAVVRSCWPCIRILCLALVGLAIGGDNSSAEELNLRLRLAWGSNDGAKHRWTGQIVCEGARLSELQPLGIEPDAPGAVLIVNNNLVIDPREKRGFDGCDVTVAGPGESLIRFELQSEQSSAATVIKVPLSKLAKEQVREPIDSLGSFLLAYRCPGDRFRVLQSRQNLIFSPGEVWSLRLKTDFQVELAAGPVIVDVTLRAIDSDRAIWQSSQTITVDSPTWDRLAFEVPCPNTEGGYRLSLSARAEGSFATRFVPGQAAKPFATREIDLVVVDPAAKLPLLVDDWDSVLSIDPANPSWWQRLPNWAQVSLLTGKPHGSAGNVRLLAHVGAVERMVELAPSPNAADRSWQSFSLPVQDVGVPHLIEISYLASQPQHLGVSIVEPDASGRVVTSIVDSGFQVGDLNEGPADRIGKHRMVFWPRTQSPQLLIVNHSSDQAGVFGSITLSRHKGSNSQLATPTVTTPATPLVSGYIARPNFVQNMGAAEVLDPASGMSVQSWSTFLEGSRRLTQYLKLFGFNSALVSVAAEGSTLYPSERLAPSPRYDTGQIAASGQDPFRKDVLEMLLRVCDREGVRIFPTFQLACPLPNLEMTRKSATGPGLTWTDSSGDELAEVKPLSRLSANYNLLDERVQHEIFATVLEIVERYKNHGAMAGVALQLDSNGWGMLPGLEWGFDRLTIETFCRETGIELTVGMPSNTAQQLLGEYRQEWQQWRIGKVTAFYAQLAKQVREHRADFQLILTTESLFDEPALRQSVRSAVSNPAQIRQILYERGIDLEQLAAIPGVRVTNATFAGQHDPLQERVAEFVLNDLAQQNSLLPRNVEPIRMAFHRARHMRLPSFDQVSPFGADRTRLLLSHFPESNVSDGSSILATLLETGVEDIVCGGDFLSLSLDPVRINNLRTWSQLPVDHQSGRVVRQRPVVVRVIPSETGTILACANESPWTANAELQLETSQSATCWELGIATTPFSAQIAGGKTTWPVHLPPYGVKAWRFSSPSIRASDLRILPNAFAKEFLNRKIEDIEARTGNLNIDRDFPQLHNPGFELEEGTARIFGWQPRKGISGSVEVDTVSVHSGSRALRLISSDQMGVAVQSHLFSLPTTGMLVVRTPVKVEQSDAAAQLTIAIETEDGAEAYRRARVIPIAANLKNQWTSVDFTVQDLPVGDAEQVRLLFHVTGKANVVLDDVQLSDLRFDDQRRTELVKRVFAAKTALDDDQYTDCLRLLNEYWPRYLVEYVPPAAKGTASLAKQPTKPNPEDEAKAKGRLRNWMPRLFR